MDPLPPGWEVHLDQQTEKYYFVDHNKKSTQWRHPTTKKVYWPETKASSVNIDKSTNYEKELNIPFKRPSLTHLDPCGNKMIEYVIKRAIDLEKEIHQFSGCYRDKEYIRIMEMLERLILELDAVDVQGRFDQRSARKNTIKEIQNLIDFFDQKFQKPVHEQNGMQGGRFKCP